MIFQPAILALLAASALGLLMLLLCMPFAWEVMRHWDIRSGSERQLQLERRTYLFSTLVTFVMALQIGALLLFIFNADRMAVMFVGAMCAVGTLQANDWGFPALGAQIGMFFLAATWLQINQVDNQARNYPLVRVKYALLALLAPAMAAVLALQWQYFANLNADVITSCCGSLFSGENKSLSGDIAALAPRPAMALFYGSLAVTIASTVYFVHSGRGAWLAATATAVNFAAGLTGIVSFVSLYVYEHPHHHCPFCLLKDEFHFLGYALYGPLFLATACGLGLGAIQAFARVPGLTQVIPRASASLARAALVGHVLFAAIATVLVWRSSLILLE